MERCQRKSSSNLRARNVGLLDKPNIVFIWADNLGWRDLSVYGCPYYKTSNLDALARAGTRFVNAYACAPMCTPSRVGFLTGRYPGRTHIGIQETLGLPHVVGDRVELSSDHPTVASLLRTAGYDTALFGKWHCGHLPTYSPLKSGFDEFFGRKTGSIDYFRHVDASGKPDLWEGDQRVVHEGYATSLFTERATEFITRRRRNPFFLCLFYNAPHWPWEGPRDKHLSDEIAGHDSQRTWLETGTAENYAEVMRGLDAGVGSVLQAIRAARLTRNTLVIFSSDQGGDEMSYLGHLRRGRLHEGGIRVPLIVSWPGVIPRNRISPQVVTGLDLTATMLSVSGVREDPGFPLDGDDLLPVLRGEKEAYSRKLFWRHSGNPRPGIPKQRALRAGDWKYLKVGKDEYLYNLAKDEEEAKDLKRRYPKKLGELRREYRKWEAQMLPYDKDTEGFKRVEFK